MIALSLTSAKSILLKVLKASNSFVDWSTYTAGHPELHFENRTNVLSEEEVGSWVPVDCKKSTCIRKAEVCISIETCSSALRSEIGSNNHHRCVWEIVWRSPIWGGAPCNLCIKNISQDEQWYSKIEREALAIVFVVKRLTQFFVAGKTRASLIIVLWSSYLLQTTNSQKPYQQEPQGGQFWISPLIKHRYKEGFSILHANVMSRQNFDQYDDECRLVEYLGPNLDELCVHFAEYKLIPFKALRNECERRNGKANYQVCNR